MFRKELMYSQMFGYPNCLALSSGVIPKLFMGLTVINFGVDGRSKILWRPSLVYGLFVLLFSFLYLKVCGCPSLFVIFQLCVFSVLITTFCDAEMVTPPSVTTATPKWANPPFYSDLVPSGSRQFSSRFRPRNQRVRNSIYFLENEIRIIF